MLGAAVVAESAVDCARDPRASPTRSTHRSERRRPRQQRREDERAAELVMLRPVHTGAEARASIRLHRERSPPSSGIVGYPHPIGGIRRKVGVGSHRLKNVASARRQRPVPSVCDSAVSALKDDEPSGIDARQRRVRRRLRIVVRLYLDVPSDLVLHGGLDRGRC